MDNKITTGKKQLLVNVHKLNFLATLLFLMAFFAPWTASWIRLPLQLKLSEAIAFVFLYLWVVYLFVKREIYFAPGSIAMFSLIVISLLSLMITPPIRDSQVVEGIIYQPGIYNLTVVARQLFYFSLYIAIINVCRSRNLIDFVLKGYIIGGIIVSLVGLLQKILLIVGWSTWGVYIGPTDPVPRIMGTFNEPGSFSFFLAGIIILLTAMILFKINIFKRVILYSCWVIVSVALIFSFSSRGAIGAIIGIVYLLLIALKERRLRISLIFISSIIVIIITLVTLYPHIFVGLKWIFTKIGTEVQHGPSAAVHGGRISGLYIAPKMFLQHPLLGIGVGNYPFFRNKFAEQVPEVFHHDLPSNVFLEFLCETGIFGFFAFISILVSIGLYVYRGCGFIRAESRDLGLIHGLVAVCLAIIFELSISSLLYFVYVWLTPALLVSLIRINIKENIRHLSKNVFSN